MTASQLFPSSDKYPSARCSSTRPRGSILLFSRRFSRCGRVLRERQFGLPIRGEGAGWGSERSAPAPAFIAVRQRIPKHPVAGASIQETRRSGSNWECFGTPLAFSSRGTAPKNRSRLGGTLRSYQRVAPYLIQGRASADPLALLQVLAKDKSHYVREAVAANPQTPGHILEDLLTEPAVEPAAASRVASAVHSPQQRGALRADYLKQLCAGLQPSFARVYGLLLEDCPPAVLTKCASSVLWLERCAVAQHPTTPAKRLQILALDSHASVRGAAHR